MFEVGDIIKGKAYIWEIIEIDNDFAVLKDALGEIFHLSIKNHLQPQINANEWTHLLIKEKRAKQLIKELLRQ